MTKPLHLIPVMNNTKWEELRLAMYNLGGIDLSLHTFYRTKCWENGYLSPWGAEWFHHFRECGYECLEWVELKSNSDFHSKVLLETLAKIHVPIERTDLGYRVYGYITAGQFVEYAAP